MSDNRDCFGCGIGERWFWRSLFALTLLLFWYTLVTRPPLRPTELVPADQPTRRATAR